MDHLWTPWRFKYVRSTDSSRRCVFCRMLHEERDEENLILSRRRHNYLVLNRFPYTTGHLMVVSSRHGGSLCETRSEELHEMILLAREVESILRQVYKPDGLNIGFNIGKSAGAGVAGHLHLHVVPRWHGDTNVVSVVGETRVIPEDLRVTYQKLAPLLQPQSPSLSPAAADPGEGGGAPS
ncbi:MAG: HIT domain-containing protein [Acidobacteriota bacterium]